ncbi:MAG: hypothetical protein ACYC2O_12735, partial [Microthrixaceae bacterium]
MTDATAELAARIAQALGRSGSVAVVGEPGAGKTFLVDHVVSLRGAAARTGGLRTVADHPLLPFRCLLGELTDAGTGDVAAQVVRHLERTGSGFLVCEDLQWFDPASIAVVAALVGSVPLLWTERLPAVTTRRLAPSEVVRAPALTRRQAVALLGGLGVAEDHVDALVRSGSGHPARLRELARAQRTELLAADLVAPLAEASTQLRRRAAWLAHVGAVQPGDQDASGQLRELVELGLAWRTDGGVALRFEESGAAAEAWLPSDERHALHDELAEHRHADPVRRARHLAAAGRADAAAEAAEAALDALGGAPTGPARTELCELAAAGAPDELRSPRWLRAAEAATHDAEYELALRHLDAACDATHAIAADPEWRRVQAVALAGAGRPRAALDTLLSDDAPAP